MDRLAGRAISLIRDGKAIEAVAEVAELSRNPTWSASVWYDFACVYSLASAKLDDKEEGVRRPGDGIAPAGREGGLE